MSLIHLQPCFSSLPPSLQSTTSFLSFISQSTELNMGKNQNQSDHDVVIIFTDLF